MLQWNALHPYSAIHVAQLPAALDEPSLRLSLQTTLVRHGLTNLALDGARSRYRYEGGDAAIELNILPGGSEVHAALTAEMERQLNTPFAFNGRFQPFRFFAAPAGDSFLLGLVYFHPAADAESVVLLLKEVAGACRGSPLEGGAGALDLYPDGRNHLLGRNARVLVRRLLALPGQVRAFRRSLRPRYRDPADFRNGFTLFTLDAENLRALVAAGKAWQVTVNDLMLALLLLALAPLAGSRRRNSSRRNLSLGCIVNLRRDLQIDSRRSFGLFLGSFTVTHEVPDGLSLRTLAGDIGRQTRAVKQHKLYLGAPLELGLARCALRFFSPEQRKKFYQKNYPLWGGITNMNLNPLWDRQAGPPLTDYFRGVSTGPATPLVLSVTTVGDRANIGLSYRSTVFSAHEIEELKCHFLDHLKPAREAA